MILCFPEETLHIVIETVLDPELPAALGSYQPPAFSATWAVFLVVTSGFQDKGKPLPLN